MRRPRGAAGAGSVSVSAAALVEAGVVAVAPCAAAQSALARQTYPGFGKGSGHAARPNLGDCFAYALAEHVGEPLLYKGDGFSHTDVEQAPR